MIWKYARNGSSVSAYYFCPSFYDPRSNSSAVVECPASGVANYNACPTDKFCTSTGLASENPCVSAAPQCGNGKLEAGEECEAGGVGCNPETCKCENGYHPASDDDEDGEPSVNCIKDVEPKPTANYSELCEGFKIPGYFCAAVFNKSETDAKAIQCGANGAFSGTFNCPAGTTCRSKGFTIYNPCNPPVDSSSEDDDGNKDSSSTLCGGKRECSGGGKGCNEKGCTCLPGFKPTVPPSVNCELNDYSKVCLSHGLGKNTTLATCLDGYTATFLICSSDGAADSFMAPCPPGTGCTAVGIPINGMPCTRDED